MTEEKQNELQQLFNDAVDIETIDFEFVNAKISAINYLHNKLKKEYKSDEFLEGHYDEILIGDDLNKFEDFTKKDVEILNYLGVMFSGDFTGFSIFASM